MSSSREIRAVANSAETHATRTRAEADKVNVATGRNEYAQGLQQLLMVSETQAVASLVERFLDATDLLEKA